MTFENFRTTLATNPMPIPAKVDDDKWADDSITYVTVTQDRLPNIKRNFPVVLPYVDRAVVVDGFSKDGSYEYLCSLGSKVKVVQNAWNDSFADQYNVYLEQLKGGWVLLCDDDEVPSGGMLKVLRELVKASENGTKFGIVQFRANDISYEEGNWAGRLDNGPCEYYRSIFFKYYPDMFYSIDLHQALQGMRGPAVQCKEHYYHIKSTRDEFRNACRNYFIAGEWPGGGRTDGIRTAEWYEMKELLAKYHPEVKLFSDFNSLLVAGMVCPEVEEWIRKNRDTRKGIDGESAGELRAYYRYYFQILHPEKE